MQPLKNNGRAPKVRILGVPDLSGLAPKGRRESGRIFRHLVVKVKRVAAFDKSGNAELMFRIKKRPAKVLHVVWLETDLLRKSGAAPSSGQSPASALR